MVLSVATVVALAWVNSPVGDTYGRVWEWHDLRHWVNDALMAVFFFVVGLEIKRELVAGELRSWRQAALPVIAAVGGMVVPALVFVAINAGGRGADGWGIPMATDIAFALGVATLLGSRVQPGVKLFLLALAIVDDIGAILVIAVFYATDVRPAALAGAVALLGLMALLRKRRVSWLPVYGVLGVAVWFAVYRSGVHATIAGVVLGLLAPARDTPSVAERLELALHPFSSLVVIPVFALANAGVVFEASALRTTDGARVAVGVGAGLVLGKFVGVTLGAYVAVRAGVAVLPDDTTWRHLAGAAALAGIGFTVSLFITDLAFADESLRAASKIGILTASVAAGVIGSVVLRTPPRTPASGPRPPATP